MVSLVTGANGFIGSHLAAKLVEKGEKVVALFRDCLPTKWLKEALKPCIRVRGDILNIKLLKRVMVQYRVDTVYHLAARAIVSQALINPVEALETNILGTANVLEAARQVGVNRVLVMSTDKVYGEAYSVTGRAPLKPTGIYETSKACADFIAQSYMKTYGMEVVIPRACNAYGYDLNPRIIPNTIMACLRGKSPIIYKNVTGERQYIYIDDLTDALIRLAEGPFKGPYNVCTDDVLTQKQVVETILKFFPDIKPKLVEKRGIPEIPGQSMVLSSFGWKPKFSFEEGIKLTIEKFKRYREDWW